MRKRKVTETRTCFNCQSNTAKFEGGCMHWYNIDGNWWCKHCRDRVHHAPKYHKRRLVYKGKRLLLAIKPRTGQCSNCLRKIGEGIKQTAMHHIKYNDDDPLKDTIELCPSCHDKESWRLGCFDNRPKMPRDPNTGRFIRRKNMS